jgi:hypothetical protein
MRIIYRPVFIPHPNKKGYLTRGKTQKSERDIGDILADYLDRKNKRNGLDKVVLSKILGHFGWNSEKDLNEILQDKSFCSAVESCHP